MDLFDNFLNSQLNDNVSTNFSDVFSFNANSQSNAFDFSQSNFQESRSETNSQSQTQSKNSIISSRKKIGSRIDEEIKVISQQVSDIISQNGDEGNNFHVHEVKEDPILKGNKLNFINQYENQNNKAQGQGHISNIQMNSSLLANRNHNSTEVNPNSVTYDELKDNFQKKVNFYRNKISKLFDDKQRNVSNILNTTKSNIINKINLMEYIQINELEKNQIENLKLSEVDLRIDTLFKQILQAMSEIN